MGVSVKKSVQKQLMFELSFSLLCGWLCSGSLHGALEETADATELCLGPHRLRRGGGGEITLKMLFLCLFKDLQSGVYSSNHWFNNLRSVRLDIHNVIML